MEAASTLTLEDYWGIAVRRKWLIMGVILLSLAVAGTLCKVLPKSYRSNTLILVENQKIPARYVQGVVTGTIQARLTMIEQQVMSRTALGMVAEEFGLYKDEGGQVSLETATEKIRSNIKVEIKGNRERVDAFSISFVHEDPVVAMKVTSRLASQFIEENLKHREQFVEGAADFLDQELSSAKAELEKKEQDISRFKSEHMGGLPQQMEANLRALDRFQDELIAIDESIQRISERLVNTDKAITEYETIGGTWAGLEQDQAGPAQLFSRLRQSESELASLSAAYKDTYPDVIATKREVESLKAQLTKEYGGEPHDGGVVPIDPYLTELRNQRELVRSELAALQRRQSHLTLEKQEYGKRVEGVPALEQELLILLRDYENMKANYNTLLGKRLDARVAENLERRQKGEQFRIIDPPNLPIRPEKPDQFHILLLGLAGGCALGFGSAVALEILKRPFRRREELEARLGLHVLATIPDFTFLYRGLGKQRALAALPASVVTMGRIVMGEKKNKDDPKEGNRAVLHRKRAAASPESFETRLVAKCLPTSVVAEQYRVVASQLSLMEAGRGSSIIVMTSSVKGEGKSTTAVNLGYTLARDLGKRTLLVDCDLKSPAAHLYLSVPREPGFSDVLNDTIPLDRCLLHIGQIPFWVLPVGGRGARQTDLPKAHLLDAAFAQLRTQFEFILVDAPPILPLADMNVLAQFADVLVLVVRADVTQQHVVHKALKSWNPPSQPHTILNGVEARSMPSYMKFDYQVYPAEGQRV